MKRTFEIINIKGLHARASAKLVAVVEEFEATATLFKDGLEASGESIMGLLMLAASKGSFIEIETEGPEAEALMEALGTLIGNYFDEGQ